MRKLEDKKTDGEDEEGECNAGIEKVSEERYKKKREEEL
jgi:hypothetical protein